MGVQMFLILMGCSATLPVSFLNFYQLYLECIIFEIFNLLFRISSVINKCMCMENYWKDSNRGKKKMPCHDPLSFAIIPQQRSTGLTWYWQGHCKLPRRRLSYRKMASFFSSDSWAVSQVIIKLF
jgi:hypothetical protein